MSKIKSILLVDDDDTSNFLSTRLITKLGVADHVHAVMNGEQAIEYIKKRCDGDPKTGKKGKDGCPQLILLDINMPVMDGFEFLEELQDMSPEERENIVIVILTSSEHDKDIEKARGYNVAGYVNKPLTKDKIQELISTNFSMG